MWSNNGVILTVGMVGLSRRSALHPARPGRAEEGRTLPTQLTDQNGRNASQALRDTFVGLYDAFLAEDTTQVACIASAGRT